MAANLKGALTVTVHSGKDLKNTATFGQQDPFCALTVGSTTFKTKVHKDGGIAPIWNQAFSFNLEGKEDLLHIKVAEDGALSDSDIGRADIALGTLLSHAGRKFYPLVDRNNFKVNAGYIELTCEFKGTGAPPVLSKSAEVAAEEKIAEAAQKGTQQAEIEKMRLEFERMKLEAEMERMRAAQAAAQAQAAALAQAQAAALLQAQKEAEAKAKLAQQQQVSQPVQVSAPVEVKFEYKSAPGMWPGVNYQGGWRHCNKCQALYKATFGSGLPCPAGDVHAGDKKELTNYILPYGPKAPTQSANQAGWRNCSKCGVMAHGSSGMACVKGATHDFGPSWHFYLHTAPNLTNSQGDWTFCKVCSQVVYGPLAAVSPCAAGGGKTHNIPAKGNWVYHIGYGPELPQYQDNWRHCTKCNGLYLNNVGCPGGGNHNDSGKMYRIPYGPQAPYEANQANWRSCKKCSAFVHTTGANHCSKGGAHETSSSWHYYAHTSHHLGGTSVADWTYCKKCNGLIYGPQAASSPCASPGTSGHNVPAKGNWVYFVASHT